MPPARHRPSPAMWLAWSLTCAGGLAVVVAVLLLANDPCISMEAGSNVCDDASPSLAVRVLALGGTLVAVVGGLAATILALRRRS